MEANGIVLSPDPRLRQECAVIEEITPAIEALAEKMKKMMFENGGCGLAAPQIGELIQLVTIDCDYSDKNDYDPYVLINPVIVEQSDHLVPFSEGCLSIPGISCEIERPDHVVVEAYDLDANLIRYEASGDLFCVCLQQDVYKRQSPRASTFPRSRSWAWSMPISPSSCRTSAQESAPTTCWSRLRAAPAAAIAPVR